MKNKVSMLIIFQLWFMMIVFYFAFLWNPFFWDSMSNPFDLFDKTILEYKSGWADFAFEENIFSWMSYLFLLPFIIMWLVFLSAVTSLVLNTRKSSVLKNRWIEWMWTVVSMSTLNYRINGRLFYKIIVDLDWDKYEVTDIPQIEIISRSISLWSKVKFRYAVGEKFAELV